MSGGDHLLIGGGRQDLEHADVDAVAPRDHALHDGAARGADEAATAGDHRQGEVVSNHDTLLACYSCNVTR